KFEMNIEGIESSLHRTLQKRSSAVVLLKMFFGYGPIEECDGELHHFERLVEARTGFLVASQFLILDTQIKVRLSVRWILFDLFQAERKIEPLLEGDVILFPHFSVMVDNREERSELKIL